MKNKIILISVSLFLLNTAKGQDIKATEVRVTEEFKPTIPEVSKLNEEATFSDTLKTNKTQSYIVESHQFKTDYKTRPLKAAKVKMETISKLYTSKVSVGVGIPIGTKASISYNSTRLRSLNYGVSFNHFNNNVKIDDKLAGKSNNNLHLYAKNIKKDKIYIANLDYQRSGAFTYGNGTTGKKNFDNSITRNNPFFNRFAYTKFFASMRNSNSTSEQMIRKITFFVSDLNEMSENQIHISGDLYREMNSIPINLQIKLNNYLNYNSKDSKYTSADVKLLDIASMTDFNKFGIDFEMGLGFRYQMERHSNELKVFPQIKVTKELVTDILLVYTGIRHIQQRHTLKSLSDENPYMHSYGMNQSIYNNGFVQQLETTDTEEFYVAMRNVLGKQEVLHASIAYGHIKNLAYFDLLENMRYRRFNVNYIDVWQLHVNANYDRKINHLLGIKIKTNYYYWDQEISHKPNLTFDFVTLVNLRDKIKVMPSVGYLGSRSSLNGVSLVRLPARFQVNLELQYNYSKILSAYLQLNNLTNSKKDLWQGYQEIGFNGAFGISYSF